MKPNIDETLSWYVVRTAPQQEAKAAENIRLAGFNVYFPRRRVELQHKRTKTFLVKERPLMFGYLFVGLPKVAPFGFVRACDGVECFLGVDGRPARVNAGAIQSLLDDEINMKHDDTRAARIHRKEEATSKKATVKMQFPTGESICVLEGPFASLHGIVEEVTSQGYIKALVGIFGRMTPVEFEPSQVMVA